MKLILPLCAVIFMAACSAPDMAPDIHGDYLRSSSRKGFAMKQEALISQYGAPHDTRMDGEILEWHYYDTGGVDHLVIRLDQDGEILSFGAVD